MHRQQRRLPQIASFALPKKKCRVNGCEKTDQHRRPQQHGRNCTENPSTDASQNAPLSPLYAIRMKAPRASHDLLCGVNTTRRKRALCSRSHTSSTVVSAVKNKRNR